MRAPRIRSPLPPQQLGILILLCCSCGISSLSWAAPAEAQIAVDGPAFLQTWSPPVYPPAARKAGLEGQVRVRLIVDPTGRVTSVRSLEASAPEFVAAAISAAKQWRFTPALEAGLPVACSMDAPVVFSLDGSHGQSHLPGMPPNGQVPQLSTTVPARPADTPDVDFPDVLFDRKLPGRVLYSCDVLATGQTENPRIISATHPDFVVPALKMLEGCHFTPAFQGELPVKSNVEGRITFDALNKGSADTLAANLVTENDGSPVTEEITVIRVVDPVWPFARLLQGAGGTATVAFAVDVNGTPRNLRVTEASEGEFGAALMAAVQACRFAGASDSGRPMVGPLRPVPLLKVHYEFQPPDAGGGTDSNPTAGLLAELVAGKVPAARGRGELKPLYRVEPLYPVSEDPTSGSQGDAEVEFVVDRTGRARLPRIISATDDAFGWAAATAVSQWVFEAPTSAGRSAVVRTTARFHFVAPAAPDPGYVLPDFSDRRP